MKEVTIYSKDYCPYCQRAKQMLVHRGYKLNIIDVQFDEKMLEEMISRSGRRTVPQIFFGDTHIGGHDDLVKHFANERVEKVMLAKDNVEDVALQQ